MHSQNIPSEPFKAFNIKKFCMLNTLRISTFWDTILMRSLEPHSRTWNQATGTRTKAAYPFAAWSLSSSSRLDTAARKRVSSSRMMLSLSFSFCVCVSFSRRKRNGENDKWPAEREKPKRGSPYRNLTWAESGCVANFWRICRSQFFQRSLRSFFICACSEQWARGTGWSLDVWRELTEKLLYFVANLYKNIGKELSHSDLRST